MGVCRLGEEMAVAMGLRKEMAGDAGGFMGEWLGGPCVVRSDAKEPAAFAEEAQGGDREWFEVWRFLFGPAVCRRQGRLR